MPILGKLQGKTVDAQLWTPIHEVESKALDQLRNIASLPWAFHHVAVMSDVHYGKGATVGSVIAMKDAVAPAAVEVDIGCLDRETEFLTEEGWIKFPDFKLGMKVLQFDPSDSLASFVKPLAYIKKKEEFFFHIKHNKGLDQMVCPNHKMLIYKGHGTVSRPISIETSSAFIEHHNLLRKGRSAGFLTVFNIDKDENMRACDMQVQIMVSADGHIRKQGYCEVHLKKERKILRASRLLDRAQIEYKVYNHKDGTITYKFIPPLPTKSLSFLYKLPTSLLQIANKEIFYWDGHQASSGQRTYSTTDKKNADAVQFLLAASGVRAGIYKTTSSNPKWSDLYEVYTTQNQFVNIAPPSHHPVKKVKSEDGYSYCFTVPSGFLVLRRNNNIFITGNCGMAAIRTSLTANDLPDNLKQIRNKVEKAIPVGFNSHDNTVSQVNKYQSKFWSRFRDLDPKVSKLLGKAKKQMGTLGGGNHFIELCLDKEQRVWVMLHSGSRNIGKTLADIHIGRARKLIHNATLPDKDLAVFLAGTKEMQEYLRDLKWAQEYAFLNRQVMLELYIEVLQNFFNNKPFTMSKPIMCHHNYVSEENHFGEDVIITRKGAISAQKDEYGIIPGSMGTKSYIVKGLGNPESFTSASHGAGRKMSRGAAKRSFSLEDLIQQTQGVECRKDKGVLDEIPSCYKDIDQVIKNQSDLVEVVHTLKQVLCVKG